jgi:CobQ/CobB/MinD/ParA family nucleotide binding protein
MKKIITKNSQMHEAHKATPNRTLTVSGGNKGGVGKSLLATTAASLLLARGEPVTLIEADPTNPDVARRFAQHAPVLLADISDRDGWIALLEALETIETPHIVMSLPAGLHDADAIQDLLRRTLAALAIDLQLIFCLSRQHDSIELIGKSLVGGLAAFAQRGIAVKNGFFGRDEQFDRWRESRQREQWISRNLDEAYLPELNHRIVDHLESQPQPLHSLASAGLTTALRLDLEDWLKAADSCLAPLWPLIPADREAA